MKIITHILKNRKIIEIFKFSQLKNYFQFLINSIIPSKMQVIRVKPRPLSFLKLSIRLFLRVLLSLICAILLCQAMLNLLQLYRHRGQQKFVAEFKNLQHNYWLDVPGESACDENTKLFILILSRRESWQNRQAIRKTWFNDRVNGTALLFFLADHNPEKTHFGDYFTWSNQTEALNKFVVEEDEFHGDIVYLNGIPDTYANLHIMMHAAFQWQQAFCPEAKYVLKTDDDTVIHLGRLDHWMANKFDVELARNNPATCFGCPVLNSKPIREENHRWFVPEELYPEESYPDYIQGCSYLCSSLAIHRIMANCPEVNALNMEDVLYTGIVAERANVSRSDQRWHFYWGGPYFSQQTYCEGGIPFLTAVFGYIYSLDTFKDLYSNLSSVTCEQQKVWDVFG